MTVRKIKVRGFNSPTYKKLCIPHSPQISRNADVERDREVGNPFQGSPYIPHPIYQSSVVNLSCAKNRSIRIIGGHLRYIERGNIWGICGEPQDGFPTLEPL
jgi:hypothetical protein